MTLLEYAKNRKTKGFADNLNTVWQDLATEMEVHPSLLKMWAYGSRQVSAQKAIPLEKATDGIVSRFKTRPDIYPNE